MSTKLKDIAAACGKSVATVSRALRNDVRLTEDTRTAIKQVAARMGYRPNLAARSLVEGQSRVIWCLLPYLRDSLEQLAAQ